jgi:hypothetical protein
LDSLSGVKDPYPSLLDHLRGDVGQSTEEPSSCINTINLSEDKEDSDGFSMGGKTKGSMYSLHLRKRQGARFLGGFEWGLGQVDD